LSETTHHLLFPREMWQYSQASSKLRTAFTIRITAEQHLALNNWIDSTIGFIPPIPPIELAEVRTLLDNKPAPLEARLIQLADAIRTVANNSKHYTVRTSMTLTRNNLLRQMNYLISRNLLKGYKPPLITPPQPKSNPSTPQPSTPVLSTSSQKFLHNLRTSCRKSIKRKRSPSHPNKRDLTRLYQESDSLNDAYHALPR